MKPMKKVLSLILALVMVLSLVPYTVFGATGTESNANDFMRVFHLDCGRKYFSVSEIKGIIDQLSNNHYTHLELAVGNDGLRFLLDDMSVTVNGMTYSSTNVTNAIKAGNSAYTTASSGELSQSEMDTIISYANGKGIEIIPLVNTPGHMDAILYACKQLCDSSAAYSGSTTTVNVTRPKAVAFTQALVNKYIQYFADKGSHYFNIGADEYAGTSFDQLQSLGYYDEYAAYVNGVATLIKNAGMKPMAFNDGIYYNGANYSGNNSITFDTDIIICYWTSGYTGYSPASVSYLQSRGFQKFIHTDESWYYVLGRNDSSWAGYTTAANATKNIKVDSMSVDEIGAMMCVWCDTPSASYSNNANRVSTLISNMANSNPTYFVASEPEVTEQTVWNQDNTVSVTGPGLTSVTAAKRASASYQADNAIVVGYDITPYVGNTQYTDGGKVTITIPDELANCSSVKVYDVQGKQNLESSVSDNVITFTTSHFSEFDLVGAVASTDTDLVEKTINLTVGETKTDVQDGSFPGTYPTADTSIATATVTTGTAAGTPGTDAKTTKVTNVSTGEYILGNGSQWIVLNADGTIGFTTDASQATKWTVTKSGSSYTIKSGNYFLVGSKTVDTYTPTTISYSNVYGSSSYYYYKDDNNNYYQVTCTRSGTSSNRRYTITYKDSSGTTRTLVDGQRNANITLYTKSSTTSNELSTSSNSENWSLSSNYGFYRTVSSGWSSTYYYIRYNNGWTVSTNYSSNNDAFPYTYTPGTDAIPGGPITTATFTGVSAGTTTVIIGGVKYTIKVLPENLNNVTPLQIEWWITNYPITSTDEHHTPDGNRTDNGKTVYYTKLSASEAYGKDGVAMSDVVPATGTYEWAGPEGCVFWKGTHLTSDNTQTGAANVDKTAVNDSATYIRYYNKAWQYSADRVNWKNIASTDQMVAYYLQKKTVNPEIDTLFKDWGLDVGAQDGSTSQVALSVAVVYPDGTLSPAENNIYRDSTLIFNYWSNRDIGIVAPVINSDYEVEKITVTPGSRVSGKSGIFTTASSDGINWEKTTTAAGTTWFKETTYWTEATGGEPVVNGATSNITWSAANKAYLVLIYLKPVHHDTNLTVQWMDDTENAVITSQEIVVDYTGSTAPTFLTHIVNNGHTGASAGTIDLKDNAYIVNKAGAHQTFNKDLTVMTNIPGKYTSGLYNYVSADISDDGKTLTLHYTLDSSKLDHNYVVDFGLPVNISLSDLGITNTANISKVTTTTNAVYNNGKITCTPSAVMRGTETVTVRVEYTRGDPATFSIGFIPATTVNYEEGFATLTGFKGGTKSATAQAKQVAGASSDEYGYDTAAAGLTNQFATSTTKGSTAEVGFTGTGIDLYVKSTADSGNVMVLIYDSSDKIVKIASVKTTSNSAITGRYSDTDQAGLIAVSVMGLDHGSYTAKMTTTTAAPVYFDGFRIYGTLPDQENKCYKDDNEDNPTFLELRDYVLTAMNVYNSKSSADVYAQIRGESGDQLTGVVLSNNNSYDGEALLKNGPKNELFLLPGQQVVFNLNTAREVQVGLKAVNGDVTVSGSVNKTISTTTDMFYTVADKADTASTKTITIKNDSNSGILSVTKVKICDDPNVSFAELTEADIAYAMSVGSAPVEPETPEVTYADAALKVSLVDYTGKVISSTSLTANGVAGETAEFSAEDIRSAAQGALAAGYGFVDLSSVNGASVVYGEDGSVQIQVGKVATLQITYKRLGKVVGTATLTHVQTSGSAKTTFTTQEIKGAAPSGRSVISILGTSVKFGSTAKINASTL